MVQPMVISFRNVDNVHFQNSAELVWHLTGAGVEDYTTQYYTDSDHSIYTNGANPAVFHKLERFMCEKWDLKCEEPL
jgi:dipeptidyl aminopeptidase/acylaminoacyl peptidase